jgi:hypothetical protein
LLASGLAPEQAISDLALQRFDATELKVLGKGSGLDSLRKDMSVRLMRKARATESPAQAA